MNKNIDDNFIENGLVVVKNAVAHDVIDSALEEVERFKSLNLELLITEDLLVNGLLFRVVNLHSKLSSLRKIFSCVNPDALNLVNDSLKSKGCVYTSLYFEKGSEQSLHRDTPYFWTNPPYAYLGFWVALEDADEFNGTLYAVPKSHVVGEPDIVQLRKARFGNEECPPSDTLLFDSYNTKVEQMCFEKGLSHQLLRLKKGDCVIWNASTLHGGIKHLDKSRTRKSFVMHLIPKNVPVAHMQYFFHPEKKLPEKANWQYIEEDGCEFILHDAVSFMHKMTVTIL
jgi:ectoine hydroxylase-related dioxygenase (phytanoyl-CoA dioxygenase family)